MDERAGIGSTTERHGDSRLRRGSGLIDRSWRYADRLFRSFGMTRSEGSLALWKAMDVEPGIRGAPGERVPRVPPLSLAPGRSFCILFANQPTCSYADVRCIARDAIPGLRWLYAGCLSRTTEGAEPAEYAASIIPCRGCNGRNPVGTPLQAAAARPVLSRVAGHRGTISAIHSRPRPRGAVLSSAARGTMAANGRSKRDRCSLAAEVPVFSERLGTGWVRGRSDRLARGRSWLSR